MFSLLTVILTLFLTVTDGSSQVLSRYYIGGAYEYDQTPDGSRERLYLGGDAYSAPMVYQRDNGGNWTAYNIGRGFTGHEVLPWFGLVNMNARLYDPLLGRFLSPDPYIQSPDFTQNFNRYSYCLNNPLKYTDWYYTPDHYHTFIKIKP